MPTNSIRSIIKSITGCKASDLTRDPDRLTCSDSKRNNLQNFHKDRPTWELFKLLKCNKQNQTNSLDYFSTTFSNRRKRAALRSKRFQIHLLPWISDNIRWTYINTRLPCQRLLLKTSTFFQNILVINKEYGHPFHNELLQQTYFPKTHDRLSLFKFQHLYIPMLQSLQCIHHLKTLP